MKTVSISRKRFKELEQLKLGKEILNTEGTIHLMRDKDGWNSSVKAVKRFYNDEGEKFTNKLYTISTLIDKRDSINIEEIVMPEKLVISAGQTVGYTMDYIDSINLKTIYNDRNYDRRLIIDYLKQIGEIIEKVHKLNNYGKVKNFYLNDVHEANFILNKETGKINVVDIDSCRIEANKPSPSRYLTPFSIVDEYPRKYKKTKQSTVLGYIEPDRNSDLYCYSVMILNFLYQDNIMKMSVKEFYEYLNYLITIGFDKELVDAFYLLYQDQANMNPKDLLEMIPSDAERAKAKVYNYIRAIRY